MSIKCAIQTNIKNIIGTKTNRKIVVIYVDDYGSIRVKDKAARNNLAAMGIPMDANRYSKFDTLCDAEDLNMMFDLLTSVKDRNGNHACLTPFANIANPDFEKIKESGFTNYYREPFTETLKRYNSNYDGVYELWKQGIADNIFHPEYHGTEHISVRLFMKALQEGHKSTMAALDNQCVAIPSFPGEQKIEHSTAVFHIEKAIDNESLKDDVKVGMQMFEDLLGYRPNQFTPGAGVYSPALHQCLLDNGIKYINVQRKYAYPMGDGKFVKKFLYIGKQNEYGQTYIVRNCPFEPTSERGTLNNQAAAICLQNVEAAFRWHAPAIISTHRVNFAGSLEKAHRDFSLQQLKTLLTAITKRWPDVEFMSGEKNDESYF